MATTPEITLHVLPPSHPSHAAAAAIEFKGLEFEKVDMPYGSHNEEMEAIYGEGAKTVPGMVVDGEPVHGSSAIFVRLEEIAPDPPLFPDPIADRVREAERWGNEQLQDLGRSLGWGALHFRPETLGMLIGGGELDPGGVDYAMKFIHSTWRYHGITAVLLAEELAGLPAKIEHIEELADEGVIGGDQPTAADLQIGSTIKVLRSIGDLDGLLEGTAAADVATRWFGEPAGRIPAGAFPASWIPASG